MMCVCVVVQILGVYTYTRKVTLDEFETKPRKTSVSVLVSCHGCCLVCVDDIPHYYRGMLPFPTSTVSTTSAIHQPSSKCGNV